MVVLTFPALVSTRMPERVKRKPNGVGVAAVVWSAGPTEPFRLTRNVSISPFCPIVPVVSGK